MKNSSLKGYYTPEQLQKNRKLVDSFVQTNVNNLLTVVKDANDNEILELLDFIRSFNGFKKDGTNSIDIEKIKYFLALPLLSRGDAEAISLFIESSVYGWQGDEYVFNNPCLRKNTAKHCKIISKISDIEHAEFNINQIIDIFLDEKYGNITTLIFSYCLSALFASKLNTDHCIPTYYLQIACDRSSAFHQLITEIVEICDINSGVSSHCALYGAENRSCHYSTHKYYPETMTERDLNELLRNHRDTPLIIENSESKKNYNALLRKIVNISSQGRILNLRDRFNLIPLFVCDSLTQDFDNVLSLDLTDFDISNDYLYQIRKNKQFFASLIFNLVENHDRYLFSNNTDGISKHNKFYSAINGYAINIENKYPQLSFRLDRNIGALNFFFKGFMNVFVELCASFRNEKFAVFKNNSGTFHLATAKANADIVVALAEEAMVKLHRHYLPDPMETDIKDKDAISLAKKIKKAYEEMNVHIHVVPTEVKDRWIFNIETLQNTKDTDVSKNAGTIQRRLKEYEFFRVSLADSKKIQLIVAKEVPQDNNLKEIFQHPDFNDPKKLIPYAIGFDDAGTPYIEDVNDFSNLLLLGEIKSGKSTAMLSLLMCIAYKHRTGDVNVIIMDFLGKKDSDYAIFNDQPFMSAPVIIDPLVGQKVIDILYAESKKRAAEVLPHIVCIIDEFPNFFRAIKDKKKKEEYRSKLTELFSSGRHSSVHVIMASQTLNKRDVVVETNNFPARMVFHFPSPQISEDILGNRNAAKLRGKGKMIFSSKIANELELQGSFMPKADMQALLKEIKTSFEQKNKHPFMLKAEDLTYIDSEMNIEPSTMEKNKRFRSVDEILPDAILLALRRDTIANQTLIKQYHIGDSKGNQILAEMNKMGLINRLNGNNGWEVIPKNINDLCEEVISLLEYNGHSKETIIQILNERESKSLISPIDNATTSD